MKTKKNKILIPIISVVSAGLLVGVGFATWTIAGKDASADASGNTISAEEIVDKRFTLTPDSTNTTQAISFSSKEDSTVANPWLTRDATVNEKLDFSFSYNLASADGTSHLNTLVNEISYTITVNDNASEGWAAAVKANYVSGSVSLTTPEKKTVALSTTGTTNTITVEDATTQSFSISGSFGWGSHFGSENPYTYYNTKSTDGTTEVSSGTTYAKDAKDSLSALKTNLADVTFTLSIKVTKQS